MAEEVIRIVVEGGGGGGAGGGGGSTGGNLGVREGSAVQGMALIGGPMARAVSLAVSPALRGTQTALKSLAEKLHAFKDPALKGPLGGNLLFPPASTSGGPLAGMGKVLESAIGAAFSSTGVLAILLAISEIMSTALAPAMKMVSIILKLLGVIFLPVGVMLMLLLKPLLIILIPLAKMSMLLVRDMIKFFKNPTAFMAEQKPGGLVPDFLMHHFNKMPEDAFNFGGSKQQEAAARNQKQVADFINGLMVWANEQLEKIKAFLGWLGSLFSGIGPWVEEQVKLISEFFGGIGIWLDESIASVQETLGGVWESVLAPIGQWLYDTIRSLITSAFSSVGNISETVKKAVDNFVKKIPKALDDVAASVGTFADGIVKWVNDNLINKIGSFFSGLPDAMRSFANSLIDMFNGLINGLNEYISRLKAVTLMVPFLGPVRPFEWLPNLPTIPKLQEGGTIRETGVAVVHKGETVVPAGQGGFGGNITVNLYNPSIMSDNVTELTRRIARELQTEMRRRTSYGYAQG